jgi:hypothetical protein
VKVICLCTPPKYQEGDWPGRLYRGLKRNTDRDFAFECRVQTEWPGWWGKMELFPATERTVYMDLDLVITGNVDFLWDYDGPLCVKRDLWGKYDTGLMSIGPSYSAFLKDVFSRNPTRCMRDFKSDQDLIAFLIDNADLWPEDKVKSYKADRLEDGPGCASIVHFHGHPKPDQLPANHWIKEYWA